MGCVGAGKMVVEEKLIDVLSLENGITLCCEEPLNKVLKNNDHGSDQIDRISWRC